jgi:hypothetical protein
MDARIRSRVSKLPQIDEEVVVETPDEVLAVFEAHRVSRGIPLNKVVQRAGYSSSSYPDWTYGRVAPKLATALDYAKALGLRVVLMPLIKKEGTG